MSNADNIRRAITKLGFFTGDIGEHQFVARLLNLASSGNSIDPSSTVDAFEAMDGSVDTSPGSDLEKLLSSLIGLTDGGTFTGNFIQDVKDFVEVGPDETAPPEKLVASMRDAGENLLFTVTAEETFGNATGQGSSSFTTALPSKNLSKDIPSPIRFSPPTFSTCLVLEINFMSTIIKLMRI